MKQQVSDSVTLVATVLAVLLALATPASALRCYSCQSGDSWSDCQSNARELTCSVTSSLAIMGKEIFLPAQARQLEPACLSLSAEGSLGGTKGYAYIRECFLNDKSLCDAVQADLPAGFKVLTCDLCTTDLCNGASSITLAFSSILLMAVAAMLRK